MTNDSPNGLTEEQVLANVFFDLYGGLDRAYGCFKINNTLTEEGEKVQGRAITKQGDYTASLWALHLGGNQGLGVVPITDDGTCNWGAIDIDKYPLDLVDIENKIKKLGLPLVVIRTKSGGAHLTMFMTEQVPAKLVRSRLHTFAMALGYGSVEIFPKQVSLASSKDTGNWLNMPYFEWKCTKRYAILNGNPLTPTQFIALANQVRITRAQLEAVEVEMSGDFTDGPPCLQMIAKEGAPEGTRNNTVFAMAVYAKMKYEDNWPDVVEEFNADFIKPQLKAREIQLVVKSVAKKEYYYPCSKDPLSRYCNKVECRRREFGIGSSAEEYNVNIGSLTKVNTEPPVWIVDIDGHRVEINTEDLMQQERFRRVCMNEIHKLPPLMKKADWEALLRDRLANVEVVDAPEETRIRGQVNQYAFQYLRDTPPARVKDEILLGRPWLDRASGMVLFSGQAMIDHLKRMGVAVEQRRIWTAMRDAGAEHSQISLKGRTITVWRVPHTDVPELSLDLPPDIDQDF